MNACAITDHGWMAGVIDFYKQCKKAGIKPILGCLLAGQEIVTLDGVKNIEDIQVGDLVLTHKGRFQPVTNTFTRKYQGYLYNIQLGQNARPIYITKEHPVLVTTRRKANKWNREKFNQAKWLKPTEIKTGRVSTHCGIDSWQSYVSLPKLQSYSQFTKIFPGNLIQQYGFEVIGEDKYKRPKNTSNKYDSDKYWNFPTTLHLDEDLSRFLGLYAAEGSIAQQPHINGQICFTFNISEIEYSNFIVQILQDKFHLDATVYERPEKSIREVVVCCLPLAYFLKHCCESGAHNKKVPSFMYNSPSNIRKAFCQGVLEGDGKSTNGTLKVSSRNLAWGMRILMADQNYWGSIVEGIQDDKYKYYMLNLATNRQYARTIEQDDKILKPIHSITAQLVDTIVYNIEVAVDNSYVSDITMHNCEAYITNDEDNKIEDKNRDNLHIVLLAKDNIGYSKLLQEVSNGALNNFYYKPRINKNNLKNLSGHVIATTACLGGIIAKLLHFEQDDYGRAIICIDENAKVESEVDFYLDIFGKDFYLELQGWDNGDNYQSSYNQFLIQFGKRKNLPFVITADAHYLHKKDYKLHELLMAMQMKMTIEQYREKVDLQYGPYFYVATPEEMLERAKSIGCPESYYNTQKITDECNVEISLGNYQEPIFKIEEAEDYKDFIEWKRSNNAS